VRGRKGDATFRDERGVGDLNCPAREDSLRGASQFVRRGGEDVAAAIPERVGGFYGGASQKGKRMISSDGEEGEGGGIDESEKIR